MRAAVATPETRRWLARTAVLAVILTAGLSAAGAFGLGLGGFHVESALNQPFAGEIDLINVGPDELDAVKATLASADDFAKAGAERYHFLTQLGFEPQLSARGSPVIRVTSRDPIREPFMDFLVEVVWPSGRLVRGYTVLLDPPGTPARRTSDSALSAPDGGAPEPARSGGASPQRSVADQTPSPAVPEAAPSSDSFPIRFGPVRPGTGLLGLARTGQPRGVTLAQTAMALYRNNQEAFVNGDINNLIVGASLTIPTDAELRALDQTSAEQELQAALRGEAVRRAPMSVASEGGDAAAREDARFRIAGAAAGAAAGTAEASPSAPQAAQETVSVAPSAITSADLEQDPPAETAWVEDGPEQAGADDGIQAEEIASTIEETAESGTRIRELEAELAAIQARLQLRAEELARLQETAPPLPSSSDVPMISGAIAEADEVTLIPRMDATSEDQIETIERPATEDAASLESDAEGSGRDLTDRPAAPMAEPPGLENGTNAGAPPGPEVIPVPLAADALPSAAQVEQAKGPAETAAASTSTWHAILLPLAGFAGFTAVGVLGFSWMSARRRRTERKAEEDLDVADGVELEGTASALSSPSVTPAFGPSEQALDAEPLPASRPAEPADVGLTAPSSQLESVMHFDAETEEADPLSEADIYVAYGRYKEAEELLVREIERTPGRLQAKFKLAEVYAASENRFLMRELMEDIQACGGDRDDPARWQRLVGIVKVVEEGGVWDPGSSFRITDAPSESVEQGTRDLQALGRAVDEAAGAAPEPKPRVFEGDDRVPAEVTGPGHAQRLDKPSVAADRLGGSPIEDEMPLLFDESALDDSLVLPEQSADEDPEWDPLADLGARESSGDAGDLILTLDDLDGSGVLDLDAVLDAPSSAMAQPEAETADMSPPRPRDVGAEADAGEDVLKLDAVLDTPQGGVTTPGLGTADVAPRPREIAEEAEASEDALELNAVLDAPQAEVTTSGLGTSDVAQRPPEVVEEAALVEDILGLDAVLDAPRPDLPTPGADTAAAPRHPPVVEEAVTEGVIDRDAGEVGGSSAAVFGDHAAADGPADADRRDDRAARVDLARAYLAMNDLKSARALLDEVLADVSGEAAASPRSD